MMQIKMHITDELEINYIMLLFSDILQHWEAAKSWNQVCRPSPLKFQFAFIFAMKFQPGNRLRPQHSFSSEF